MASAASSSEIQAKLLSEGDRVGRYRVVRLTGKGGMGVVYEAVDEGLGRRVALKLLHQRYATDELMLRRFFNEARAANLAEHPGIVQISDAGQLPGGQAYLVMEFLAGTTLSSLLERGPLDEARARALGAQVAAALAAAHERGIVHRDLKPSNIMLVPDPARADGTLVKVVDFGIARLGTGGDGLTATGVILGTALYMAPEQCQASKLVDSGADVYALGALLFHALAGQPPFVGNNDVVIATQHLCTPPPPLRHLAPQVSESLAQLIERTLAKEPALRPGMAEVQGLLEEGARALPLAGLELAAADATSTATCLEVPHAAPGGRRWPLLLLGAGALVGCLLGAVWRLLPGRSAALPPAEVSLPQASPPLRAPVRAPVRAAAAASISRGKDSKGQRRVRRPATQTQDRVPPGASGAELHTTPLVD